MKLNSYYIYIEKERTRVYSSSSHGKPLILHRGENEFDEFYNTYRYNYEFNAISIEPFHRSFEPNYNNFFDYKDICGLKNDNLFFSIVNIYLESVLDLLNDRNAEIRFLYAWSFFDDLLKQSASFNYDSLFENFINTYNQNNNSHFVFRGGYFVHMLVLGFINTIRDMTKRNLLYVDEKNVIFISKNKKGSSVERFIWGGIDIKAKYGDDFKKYLTEEEFFVNEFSSSNLKNYIISEIKHGNDINNIRVVIRDEEKYIDCHLVKDYIKKLDNKRYNSLKEYLGEHISTEDNNVLCFKNIRNEIISKRVDRILKKYNFRYYYKDNFFETLLKFCKVVDKYNNAFYRKKIYELARKKKLDLKEAFFVNKVYTIDYFLSNESERKNICKELGFDILK